jgi:hypothetical protein
MKEEVLAFTFNASHAKVLALPLATHWLRSDPSSDSLQHCYAFDICLQHLEL